MYCKNCGNLLNDNDKFCPKCGYPVNTTLTVEAYNKNMNKNVEQEEVVYNKNIDSSNMGFSILCFFFPLVGLILYLVWRTQFPKRAKSCAKGAIFGFIVNILFSFIYSIVLFMISK